MKKSQVTAEIGSERKRLQDTLEELVISTFTISTLTSSGVNMEYSGDLRITAENLSYAATITSVSGTLQVKAEARLPALTSVGGDLSVEAEAHLPALTSVGGALWVDAEARLPALTSVGGNLWVDAEAHLPALTSVGGSLSVDAEAHLPALTRVGGTLEGEAEGLFLAAQKITFKKGEVLVISEYALHYKDGFYSAGCRGPWSAEQALKHWEGRTDERAIIFTKVIKSKQSQLES